MLCRPKREFMLMLMFFDLESTGIMRLLPFSGGNFFSFLFTMLSEPQPYVLLIIMCHSRRFNLTSSMVGSEFLFFNSSIITDNLYVIDAILSIISYVKLWL